ncbi:hypothetical protein [Nocardioides sp. W7]|uniref:hypothetical protein n=1 Tax=Nocardioides sp. W7 TaxID=2931390 RepID=UPI001FD1EF04|nr:hypothetical protein [Nocardioides sp. W7]
MSRTSSRLSAVLLAVATVLVVAAGLLVASPASAAGTGSLAGEVQAKPAGGAVAPLADANVQFYRSDTPDGASEAAGSTTTGADGTWSVSNLEDGYYVVWVIAPDDSLADEYWDDAVSVSEATPVHVTGGAVTLPRPIVLETPGWVTGRVLDEAGQPVVGASVSFRESEMAGGAGVTTDADGRYDSRVGDFPRDLIPGDYIVNVTAYSNDLDDPVYYDHEVKVPVTAGAGTTHDVILAERPSAVITVLDAAGQPLAEAPIGIQFRMPDFMNGWWGPIQSGPHETDLTGRYRITDRFDEVKVFGGLPDGHTGPEVGEWYDGAYAASEARAITFPAGVEKRRELTIRLGAAPTAVQAATPTITGVARVGRRLTATPGSWGPTGVELSYQWLDRGFEIPGATGSTLTIPASVEDGRLAVRVTGKVPGQPAVDRTSAETTVVLPSDGSTDPDPDPEPEPDPEVAAATPRISGTPRAGRVLTAVPGAWGPAGVALAYTWTADGVPAGTGPTLRVTNALAGRAITLTVRGDLGGASTVRSSTPTAAVRGVLSTARPRIVGKAKVGRALRARAGSWGPGRVTLRLTWFRNGTKVRTGTAYRLTRRDVGKRISVRVTGSRQHFDTVTVRSAKTARVTRR